MLCRFIPPQSTPRSRSHHLHFLCSRGGGGVDYAVVQQVQSVIQQFTDGPHMSQMQVSGTNIPELLAAHAPERFLWIDILLDV